MKNALFSIKDYLRAIICMIISVIFIYSMFFSQKIFLACILCYKTYTLSAMLLLLSNINLRIKIKVTHLIER